MADSDHESIPLLQLCTPARDEDLDESRETETTDDECGEEPEAGVYVVPSCSSYQSKDDPQENYCRESEAGPSDQSNKDGLSVNCSREPEIGLSHHSTNNDRSESPNTEPVAGRSGLCRHLNNSSNCVHCAYRKVIDLEHSGSSNSSQNSNRTLNLQVKKGKEALSYFAGDALTSSSDSYKVSSNSSSVDLGCVVEYTLDEDGNVDYVDIDLNDTISEEHMVKLSKKLRLNHYTAISCEVSFKFDSCLTQKQIFK